MNLSRRTSLSLLIVSLSTAPAHAALSADGGSVGVSIETTTNNTTVQPLDQLLGGGNSSDLFGSVLQQHATAAQPAISTMDGFFGSTGATQPVLFNQKSPTGQIIPGGQTMPSAPFSPTSAAPDFSLTVAVNKGAAALAESTPTAVASQNAPFVPNTAGDTTPQAEPVILPTLVPLPSAALLLVSGLAALPAMRRKRQK
jgi:hypothetical protein